MSKVSSPLAPHQSFASKRKYSQCKHLTIFTPLYHNSNDMLIRTAPIPTRTKNNKVTKKYISPNIRFPSPPIVPSQQPTTNTTTSWRRFTPTKLTQKQKFLQPFEYLYDTMEQARANKDVLGCIQECVERIERLEYKIAKNIPITPSSTPPPQSTNDMKSIFSQLSSRIDQLESRLTN